MDEQIGELRTQMDEVDRELLSLFERRMALSNELGLCKKKNDLPILDPTREREKLAAMTEDIDPALRRHTKILFNTLFELSRSRQAQSYRPKSDLLGLIDQALETTPKIFPDSASVACQGVEGAYSQQACDRLFSLPNIMYCNTFQAVFQAVEAGLCRYGVLPLENSSAGSVNEVYELMSERNFFIVRGLRLNIQHTLLAARGVKLSDITEIYSHDQAIQQCSRFLKSLNGVKVTSCENTAQAARDLSISGRQDTAVIASQDCAELYGLSELAYGIQDTDNNYTRFICISKNLEVYPGANKTSIIVSLPHHPGSLYSAIAKFNALGINILKLESRPIAGMDFEFKFYFDFDASVYAEEFKQVISELENEARSFTYLGSYQEL
jgi:chorismate mutase/prephenate dehydratase